MVVTCADETNINIYSREYSPLIKSLQKANKYLEILLKASQIKPLQNKIVDERLYLRGLLR